MTRTILLTIAALMVAPAAAQDYTDADGIRYTLNCSADGYVLAPENSGTVLYLGKSCDALHGEHGAGKWCWANGGFVAELADDRVNFPRQELVCDPAPDFAESCRC